MSFTLDMSKFAKKAKGNIDLAVKRTVAGVAESVVTMSPVGDPSKWDIEFKAAAIKLGWIPEKGYIGGRFRANWDYGFNSAPTEEYDTRDKTKKTSMNRIDGALIGKPAAGIHYLANNLPYGQRLEDGYSSQAPHGFVQLTVLKFQSIVDEAARGLA